MAGSEQDSTQDLVPDGSSGTDVDVESKEKKKLPYPTSVFFIVGNEFCERFSYYGMKAVLTLYFKKVLKWDDDFATVIYHVFSMFAYFTPLFGAMIADSLLGKFRTIFYLSVVYCLGNVVLSLAATPPINIPAVPFSMIGLALIAIGTGGIKPCVAAFGGDQFKLPEQEVQLASFFSVFYFSINSGSLLSTILTPIFREDVKCFEQENCFSLAFSVPAALMITALIIFLVGKPLYKVNKPQGNVVIKVIKCISTALSNKGKNGPQEHWLDNAIGPVYDKRFVEDVKIVLRVLLLYLPLPVFWALFDQQGSRWTLQATRMDGKVTDGFTIKPDQVQVLNPALILIFIPLFDQIIYPLLAKCHILTRPLQRLTTGGILAGVAFVVSGIVELQLEDTYPVKLERGQSNLHFINAMPCPITISGIQAGDGKPITYAPGAMHVYEAIASKPFNQTFTITPDLSCGNFEPLTKIISPEEEKAFTVLVGMAPEPVNTDDKRQMEVVVSHIDDDREKPEEGFPKLRFYLQGRTFEQMRHNESFYLRLAGKGDHEFEFEDFTIDPTKTPIKNNSAGWASESRDDLEPESFSLFLEIEGRESLYLTTIDFQLGGSYIATITPNYTFTEPWNYTKAENYVVTNYAITAPSSMKMWWLLPQYIIITMAEIMFSVTGLEFSYSQSPVSMKSVLQAAWLLTVAFGNLIVVIVAEAKFFEEQSKEFFLFAGLIFVAMLIFSFMAWRYIPAKLEDPNAPKDKEIEDKKVDE